MPDELQSFLTAIKTAAAKDTSADPDHWTPDNPLWGHCAVAALIIQDYFGGELRRIYLTSVPHLSHLRSHYINILPDGTVCDATSEQFSTPLPADLPYEHRNRERLLANADTAARYLVLKTKVKQILDTIAI